MAFQARAQDDIRHILYPMHSSIVRQLLLVTASLCGLLKSAVARSMSRFKS